MQYMNRDILCTSKDSLWTSVTSHQAQAHPPTIVLLVVAPKHPPTIYKNKSFLEKNTKVPGAFLQGQLYIGMNT
jgi:hypothetical protein